MTDRELLEMAAKAAGLKIMRWDATGAAVIKHETPYSKEAGWNPLSYDGDALRLAVKLGLLVDVRYTRPEAARYNEVMYWPTPVKGERIVFGDREMDPYAATRRAIVRAAAELGKAT